MHTKIDIKAAVEMYKAKLLHEMGLDEEAPRRHFKRPKERPFTAKERANTTILFGGLTQSHEICIKGGMEALGYRAENLPVPDNEALHIGKEYGNRGQCNPTYYTVGNLVKTLQKKREGGETGLEDKYVFITAGSCGPCRFGMYEAEYRKALRDTGFDAFRVLLFQQSAGLDQSGEEAGLTMNKAFFVTILKGMIMGDLLNDVGHQIRPYEVTPGKTDAVLDQARDLMYRTFRGKGKIYRALREVRRMFDGIEVDYLRCKPRVKITGEFWAQTTEGDGNYRLMSWLEQEGAEVLVEPIATWIMYMIWGARQEAIDRKGLNPLDRGKFIQRHYWRRRKNLWLAQVLFGGFYDFYRWMLGGKPDPLIDQDKLAQYAQDYYNTHLGGGEGHLEVAKNIYATHTKKTHMMISLKPFGCMPSTQSDGVQSKVVSDFPDSIFIPIETSGDSEVNAKSRVQMKLYEAKQRARQEFYQVLEDYGLTLDEARDYVRAHPSLGRAMRRIPHHVVGTGANMLIDVARRMGKRPRYSPEGGTVTHLDLGRQNSQGGSA